MTGSLAETGSSLPQPSVVSENLKSFPSSYQGNHSPARSTVMMKRERAETDSSPLTSCQGGNTHSRVSKEAEASGQRNIPYLPVQSIPGLVFLQPSPRWVRRQARTQLPTPLGGMVGISSTASQNGRCCRSWPQPLLLKSTG